MKKRKRTKNKRNKMLAFIMAIVLAAGIFIPSLMNWTREARAAAKEPRLCFYADADQLMKYGELMEGLEPAERWEGYISFGGSSADRWTWYIAGKDQSQPDGKDNAILFRAGGEQGSNPTVKIGYYWDDASLTLEDRQHDKCPDKKTYSKDASIQYEGGFTPAEVNLNHYGDSDLRKEFLRLQNSTSAFSAAEKQLMLTTQVTTWDSKNQKWYTVEDILYAPTVADAEASEVSGGSKKEGRYLLVGGGSDESKMTRIRYGTGLDLGCWTRKEDELHLSSVEAGNARMAYCWDSLNGRVDQGTTYYLFHAFRPAFALDLTDILFASSVPVLSTDSRSQELTNPNTKPLTLRMKDPGTVFQRTKLSYTMDQITWSGAPSGAWVVVQGRTADGKDWYYKKNSGGSITWDEVSKGVSGVSLGGEASFHMCKVWMEAPNSASASMPYAFVGTYESADDTEIDAVRITGLTPEPEKSLSENGRCTTTGVLSNAPASWSEGGNDVSGSAAEYDKTYTASVTLTAGDGYIFGDSVAASVEGGEVLGVTKNSDKSITVTCRFVTGPDTSLPRIQYTGGDRYSGVYDDLPHTITPVVVSDPTDAVISYGIRRGEYTLTDPPEFTDAGSYRVWFRIEKEGYETVEREVGVEIRKRTISISIEDQTIRWGEEIDKTRYRAEGELVSGHEITEVNLTPSTTELTEDGTINLFARNPVTIVDRDENNKDVSKNYEVRLASPPGQLIIEHDPELPPEDDLEISKEKTEYMVGDELDVNDITVTVKYEDGYTTEVPDYETNADEIDMSVPGEKIITVTYTENGKTVTGDIPIQVNGEANNSISEPGQDEPNQPSDGSGQTTGRSSSEPAGSGAGSGGGSSGGGTILYRTISGAAKTADTSEIIPWSLLLACSGMIVIGAAVKRLGKGNGKKKK